MILSEMVLSQDLGLPDQGSLDPSFVIAVFPSTLDLIESVEPVL